MEMELAAGCAHLDPFFNHSCDPNLVVARVDSKLAFVVVKPIAAGGQLFVSYCCQSSTTTKNETIIA